MLESLRPMDAKCIPAPPTTSVAVITSSSVMNTISSSTNSPSPTITTAISPTITTAISGQLLFLSFCDKL